MALMVQKRLDQGTHQPVIKTPTPLGLHQGSVVTMPDVDLALAKVDGSVIKAPTGTQVITAVGVYNLFGMSVFNSYLDDGNSYIQVVTNGGALGTIQDTRLFSNFQEVEITSAEEWEFWLGRYQKFNGEIVRDPNTGLGVLTEAGLIGWPQFQIDGDPPIVYNRSWSTNVAAGIDPVSYSETITDITGNQLFVKHEAMEYYRQLTTDTNSVVESLLASMVRQPDKSNVDIMIGIPLDHTTLQVLTS
jgi:hypothetical protein